MASRAKTAARFKDAGGVVIDHSTIVEEDYEWLADVERLTLWNVKVPEGFLAHLKQLWWVDWRGGGKGQNVEQLAACSGLRYVSLNQIRGLNDLGFLTQLASLEMLSIYGLSAVLEFPSLRNLSLLRRLEVGQMKLLASIHPALEAPILHELFLIRKLNVTPDDVRAIKSHSALSFFEWFAEDVPDRVWLPVRDAIKLPPTRPMHPEEWFSLQS